MTRAEAIICKIYLEDLDKYHTCNEYKLLMGLLEQEPCADAISRAEALKHSFPIFDDDGVGYTVVRADKIEQLPPVKPVEKVGQWIDGKCNRCGTHAPYWAMASTYYCSDYCPKCGAKMQEVEDEVDN